MGLQKTLTLGVLPQSDNKKMDTPLEPLGKKHENGTTVTVFLVKIL
jgi:hypothetical protein